jgi:hypothetical protein
MILNNESNFEDLDLITPALSPLPNKINNLPNKNSLKVEQSLPKLDLSKAKKIQEINAKKSTL